LGKAHTCYNWDRGGELRLNYKAHGPPEISWLSDAGAASLADSRAADRAPDSPFSGISLFMHSDYNVPYTTGVVDPQIM